MAPEREGWLPAPHQVVKRIVQVMQDFIDFQGLQKHLTFIDEGTTQAWCTLKEPFNLHAWKNEIIKTQISVLKIPFDCVSPF